MSDMISDVVVIGAGVIGSSIAFHLTQRGLSVALIDKNEPAGGTSGACDGLVFCQSKKPGTHLKMAMASKQILDDLAGTLPFDMELEHTGGLVTIESEAEYAAMRQYVAQQQAAGLDVALIDGQQAREIEPALAPTVVGAAYSPVDSQINPLTLNLGLAFGAKQRGATLLMREQVTAVLSEQGRVTGVKTDKRSIACKIVVNAAGIYAPEIGKMVGLKVPIKPRRGQLLITEPVPKLLNTCMISASYIAQKFDPSLAEEGAKAVSIEQTKTGSLLLGSSREFVGFDRSTTPEAISRIAANAARVIPALKKRQIVRVMAGLRPYTPDGLPILGKVDGLEGFIMAAGHEGDGIALSAITGALISQLVVDNVTQFALDEFALARFSTSALEGFPA